MRKNQVCGLILRVYMFSLVLLFAGCSDKPEVKDRKTFTFWYTSGQRELWKIIRDFNASQDSVYCEGSYQGSYGQMMQKLLVATSTGNQPVLGQIEQSLASRVVEYGTVMSLDSLLEVDPDLSRESFIQPILASCIYNDKVYAIPTNTSTIVLFYNKDLFRRAGLEPDKPPRTWQEVEEMSRIVKAKLGPGYYGMNLHIEDWDLEAFTWQWGGRVISDDGKRVLINSQPGLEALSFLSRMVKEELFCITYGKDVYQFVSGKAAMTNKSCAALTWMLESTSFSGDLALSLCPYEEISVSPTGGANIYMFKGSTDDEVEAAWAFIKYMLSLDNQIRWSKSTGYMVCMESVLNSQEMEEQIFLGEERRRIPYEQLLYSRVRPRFGPYNEVNDRAVHIYKSAVAGENSPKRALELIEEMGNLVIRKYY
ncbi:ABC transporter substrate-binding protein [bacterium]|nr:ABC transporter substrate-binding protein [bacterium]